MQSSSSSSAIAGGFHLEVLVVVSVFILWGIQSKWLLLQLFLLNSVVVDIAIKLHVQTNKLQKLNTPSYFCIFLILYSYSVGFGCLRAEIIYFSSRFRSHADIFVFCSSRFFWIRLSYMKHYKIHFLLREFVVIYE